MNSTYSAAVECGLGCNPIHCVLPSWPLRRPFSPPPRLSPVTVCVAPLHACQPEIGPVVAVESVDYCDAVPLSHAAGSESQPVGEGTEVRSSSGRDVFLCLPFLSQVRPVLSELPLSPSVSCSLSR